MVVKTLQVFYGGDCLPYKDKEHKVHYPIVTPAFQGASQVNEIKFYVDYIGGSMLKWLAVAKLPNGRIGMKLLDFAEDELGTYVTLTLTQWFTQAKGDLYVSLKGFDGESDIVYDEETGLYHISGEPTVQATGSVKITIQYATPLDENDYGDITIQELIGYINTKLDKNSEKYFKVVDNLASINSSLYADYLKGGDIIYSKNEDAAYVLSGTYPTLTYTKLLDFGDIVTLTTEQTISGQKTFSANKTYVTTLVSGNDEELATYHYVRINQDNLTISRSYDNANHYFNLTDYLGDWCFRFGEGANYYRLYIPIVDGTLATQEWVTTQISDQIAKVYKPQGDATVSELNGLTKTSTMEGYVYNLSGSGILTNSDSTTLTVQEGDNVAFIWNNGSWKWDNLKGIVDLSGYVTTNTTQEISGDKTFSGTTTFAGQVSFTNVVRVNLASFVGNIVPSLGNSYYVGASLNHYARGYINSLYGVSYNFETDKAYQILYGLNIPLSGANIPISYENENTITIGKSDSFTLQTPKTGCLPEYHGTITNNSQTAITLTFVEVSTIRCNDDNLTITNSANSTIVLTAGTTIEFSIYNGKMVAYNFAAE